MLYYKFRTTSALPLHIRQAFPSVSTPYLLHYSPELAAMAVVTGALGSIAPKLLQLLQDEYMLQKNLRAEVESLSRELEAMYAALCKVAQVRHDDLDPQLKLWASEVPEASYDMEDIIDTFLVHVDGGHQPADANKNKVERLTEKMGKLFSLSKLKARHDIAGAIEKIKKRVDDMTKRRERYKTDCLMSCDD